MPPETNQKQFAFTAGAGAFFVMWLVVSLIGIIPFIGWVIAFNYQNNWFAKYVTVSGRKLSYKAGFGETFVFLLVGVLLTAITFGIYIFWFAPKIYRYIADHMSFADETAAPVVAEAPTPTPVTTPPINPTPPTTLIQ